MVPGTAVHDAVRYALDDYDTDARLTDSLAGMLIAVAVGYSAIATANGTALSVHGRRRDLAVLRSAGGTAGQLVLFAAAEAALVTVIGTALGLLAALPPLAGLASGLSQSTGAPRHPPPGSGHPGGRGLRLSADGRLDRCGGDMALAATDLRRRGPRARSGRERLAESAGRGGRFVRGSPGGPGRGGAGAGGRG
ncbi:FtsX-like permease family protein [Kitasatospora sp. NPDC091335]|uniref:FtsX-like permease family protein n=1 Tax=Kitasatospora sp. NPDC091335 TaxID=3364085 RepID=UPI00380AAD7D